MKILRCGKLIDGTGERVIENAVLIVKGSKILRVGDDSAVDIPRNAVEIDCSDKTVLPGLIDTHLHFALGPGETYEEQVQNTDSLQLVSGVANAQFTLESGVTMARDLGARNRVALDLREAERNNIILAPRLLVCGRSITMTGGHFHFCNAEADGYEGVRKVTRQLLKEGVDFIKIMTSGGGTKGTRRELASYTVNEIKGAVDEAHRQGKTVTAHCHATQSIANVIEAGVDIIEHCTFLEPDRKGIRYEFQEDLASKIIKKGIYVDKIISTGRLETSFENLRRFLKLGAKILPGTDGLRLYQTALMPLYLEMHTRGGMTPMESIISATKTSAEASGVCEVLGTLEEGKEADLIAVEGDPLQEIQVLRNPKLVMKGGVIIQPTGRIEAKAEMNRLAETILPTLEELGIEK